MPPPGLSEKNTWRIFNSDKVPILRGKINLVFFLILPVVLYFFSVEELSIDGLTFAIFTLCSSFSFVSSITLHWKIWDQENYSTLRKIDYAGIFLIIGGCGLPSYLAFMKSDFVVILMVIHWILIFTGVFSSLLFNFCYTSKRVRSIIYVLMSTPYYFLIPTMFNPEHYDVVLFLLIGGLFYTVGACIYGCKLPNLIPGVFEYHELFHICSLIGFSCMSTANFLLCKKEVPLAQKLFSFVSLT